MIASLVALPTFIRADIIPISAYREVWSSTVFEGDDDHPWFNDWDWWGEGGFGEFYRFAHSAAASAGQATMIEHISSYAYGILSAEAYTDGGGLGRDESSSGSHLEYRFEITSHAGEVPFRVDMGGGGLHSTGFSLERWQFGWVMLYDGWIGVET